MNIPPTSSDLLKSNILIVGVTRNCETTLQNNVTKLQESLKNCRSISWLVVESDSSDKTMDVLGALKGETPNFRFISLGALYESMPIRTQRIAYCRNVYMDELRSNPLYSDIDYVVVADLDRVNNLITEEGIASCWKRDDWDVCTANQRGPYYDIWALRHPAWSPGDCWQEYDFLRSRGSPRELAAWASMYTKMITIGETADWIEVESAFGGLAVYRRQVLDGLTYCGVDAAGEPVCEHVSLHEQIRRRGGRIFINPAMINTADTDQSFQRSLPQTLKRCYLDLRHASKMRFLSALGRR
jgi:hypothetical protein